MPAMTAPVSGGSDRPIPVLLTFDVDAETLWTARDPSNARRPVTLSQGSYGPRVGLPRIVALLEKHGITATFFVPGLTAERHPEAIRNLHERGHEIAHHMYSHKWLDDMEEPEERREFEQGIAAIERVTGVRPRGFRAPAVEFSPNTLRLLLEYGFEYSSNFFDADAPYRHVVDGVKTDLVELPFQWPLGDAPFFLYSVRLTGRSIAPLSAVLEHWIAEFDGLYAEGNGLVLTCHPQLTGRPSRIPLLEAFIQHARSFPHVWFGRCDEWVRRVRDGL